MMRHISISGMLATNSAMLMGCNRGKGVRVHCAVTYDGQPIEMGDIRFLPQDPRLRSHVAVISHGKFEANVTPGSKRVEITASRPVQFGPSDPDTAHMREDFLPEKFNRSSTMSAEFKPEGENLLTFDLKSA